MKMKEIELLEQELKMLLENIDRVKEFANSKENKEWKPWASRVVGELKHRCIALKGRLTSINKIATRDLWF